MLTGEQVAARLVSVVQKRSEPVAEGAVQPAKSVAVYMPANKPTIDLDVFALLGRLPVRSLAFQSGIINVTPAKVDALLQSCADNSTLRRFGGAGCVNALTEDTVSLA